ncbi:MAG: orotidine-5'-phosphate decarboxylase [Epsilonproteobacteria bacterium]|nr:orotidine-5'-phosphate decarboxylase [Campylobacterota bacterium]
MKLCVALDLPTLEENLNLANMLKEFDIWLKVGFRSYIRDGKKIIEELKSINPNFKIFLDLKIYDIPNTMADAASEISELGVDMFNIHISSGAQAMKAVMQRISNKKDRPLVLGVSVLTSFDNQTFKKIYGSTIEKKSEVFAKKAYECKLDGIVCSAYESKDIKELTKPEFLTLTPGIRPFGEDSNDQKRVANLEIAKENLVDFIVVGRPIYLNSDPRGVVQKILKRI